MTITEHILKLIDETKECDAQLEKKIGLGKNNILFWRQNRSKPSLDACIKIADYFNITLDELIGRTEPKNETMTPLDPATRELLNGWQTLNESQRQRVLGLIQGLKQPSGIEQAFNAGRNIGREKVKSMTKNHGGNIA